MSHSDSEIRDDLKAKLKRLHLDFKAKKRCKPPDYLKTLKHKLRPIYQEIRLVQAVNFHNTDEVKKLLESGVSPNSTDAEMRSALHVAVSKGYADIVQILLNYGADPNQRDVIQNTPLHLAVCVHNLSIITMLINAKADVSSLNLHGRNPLELASSKLQILQRGWREGAIEMVNLRSELRQVVDLLLSLLSRRLEEQAMEKLNTRQTNVDDLQVMKLSLNSKGPEELDDEMSRLLNDIEKFKIT